MKVLLIRHGMTPGNKEKRYIGRTDETLSESGRQLLKEKRESIISVGIPEALFVSPLLRCKETASIFYPELEQIEIEDLREFDFGIFENKNYMELTGNQEYQKWIDSMCEAQVPGGESMASFKERCRNGFCEVLDYCSDKNCEQIALVVHGGTIMSLMEVYADQKKGYYDWSVKNGEGYLVELNLEQWHNGKAQFHLLKKIERS